MPLKTKTKSKPALPAVRFSIRRIANRNPRNIRGFQAEESRLKRVFAGFLILLALLILALAGNINQSSESLQADVIAADSATTNSESSCTAQVIGQNLSILRAQKIKLITRYVDYLENSTWEKIPAVASELQNLNTQITTAEKGFDENRKAATITLTRLENEVLLCANNQSCAEAEEALAAKQNCEKQIKNTVIALEEQTKILAKYRFRDAQKNLVGKVDIQKIFTTLDQYRAKTDSQQTLLEKCLADNIYQGAACTKNRSEFEKARDAEVKQFEKIADLANPLVVITKTLDTDITTLKFAEKNGKDSTPNQGLGWCQQSLSETSAILNTKVSESADLKAAYNDALQQLAEIKAELNAHIIEMAEQITATTAQLNFVFKATTLWKIFSGIF
jgi:hypothetical protein